MKSDFCYVNYLKTNFYLLFHKLFNYYSISCIFLEEWGFFPPSIFVSVTYKNAHLISK